MIGRGCVLVGVGRGMGEGLVCLWDMLVYLFILTLSLACVPFHASASFFS